MADTEGEGAGRATLQASAGEASGDRPVIELFVRAALDKMKNGSCPTCHRYFLLFYILLEEGYIDLVVTTCLPSDPPVEVKNFTSGKHYPVIIVHKGTDSQGNDITGMEIDNVDDIEKLVSKFDCERTRSRKQAVIESDAETSFEDLYKTFNLFLQRKTGDTGAVIRCLAKVNQHLMENETKFMVEDKMCRADAYLIPTLQHMRVAGNYYKGFEIPTEMTYIWHYLENVYKTTAFDESCPSDREIIKHYENRAIKTTSSSTKVELMKDRRTQSIPTDINTVNHSDEEDNEGINHQGSNGQVESSSYPHVQVDSTGVLQFDTATPPENTGEEEEVINAHVDDVPPVQANGDE